MVKLKAAQWLMEAYKKICIRDHKQPHYAIIRFSIDLLNCGCTQGQRCRNFRWIIVLLEGEHKRLRNIEIHWRVGWYFVKINPEYKEYVSIESCSKVLHVQLLKAFYGYVVSALLWYEMFSGSLKEMGLKINPYDSCISNKIINGI